MEILIGLFILWLSIVTFLYFESCVYLNAVTAHPVVKTEWDTVPRQLKPCKKRTQCPNAETCYADVPCSHPDKPTVEVCF